MEYRQGLPLNQVVAQAGGHLSEDRALEIILPLLDGLEVVHKKGFLHRDIKPQNIYLTDKGVPLLLDFGASRFALTDSTKTLTVMLSSGYAPFEQYHKKGKQGVWSDIYSIGATLYFMSTGKMPADAIERQHEDNIIAPKTHNPKLSSSFNQAILLALSVNPKSRPVSINELKQILLSDVYQIAPFKQSIIAPKATLLAPIIKPSNSSVTIRYNSQNNRLSFGRVLIYMGIVAILWSGWSTRQMLENNDNPSPQIIISSPADTEDFTILEDVVYETYEETIEPIGYSSETEMVSTSEVEDAQNFFSRPTLSKNNQAINIPSPQNIQNQKPPELPHPIHQPLYPAIPNAAFRVLMCQIIESTDRIRLGSTLMKIEFKNSDEVKSEKILYEAANTDPLTNIANRRAFMIRAEEEISFCKRNNSKLAIVMCDVDHFKKTNDNFGHPAGDLVLKELANILQTQMRKEDILARFGGEEFIMLLRSTDVNSVAVWAERVRKNVEKFSFIFEGVKIPTTLSIGVCSLRGDKITSLGDLIKKADDALYLAKNNGRNQVKLI